MPATPPRPVEATHVPTADLPHRRRRTSRGESGADTAQGRLHRTHRTGGRRDRAPIPAAAAVQGLPQRRGGARHHLCPQVGLVPRPRGPAPARRPRRRLEPGGTRGDPQHRRADRLRQAAAYHRFIAAPAHRARRRPGRGALPAPAPGRRPTPPSADRRRPQRPGHRRRLDRAGGGGGRPRSRQRRDTRGGPSQHRCAPHSETSWVACSPTCIASTASTCGSTPASRTSPATTAASPP